MLRRMGCVAPAAPPPSSSTDADSDAHDHAGATGVATMGGGAGDVEKMTSVEDAPMTDV